MLRPYTYAVTILNGVGERYAGAGVVHAYDGLDAATKAHHRAIDELFALFGRDGVCPNGPHTVTHLSVTLETNREP